MRSGVSLLLCVGIVLGTVLGAMVYGQRRVRQRTMSEWAIGNRRLGTWIFWFLNAGEIYTTFAVLGIAGYAWAYGAPAYLALTSVSLASAVGYWLMPRIWAAGHRHGHQPRHRARIGLDRLRERRRLARRLDRERRDRQ